MVMENEDPTYEVRPYPQWRAALEAFLAAGFRPGDVIPHEWFYNALGVEMPAADTSKSLADRLELQYLSGLTPLRRALLEDYQIDLQTARTVGYEWVKPAEQAPRAACDFDEAIRKVCRSHGRRAACVDYAALTSQERQQQADHLNHIARMRSMFKQNQRRRLPPPPTEQEGQSESA